MEKISQVITSKILRFGCSEDKKTGWIDFAVDEQNVLRLSFPVEFPPDIKLDLSLLQKHIAEERQKVGLPVVQHTYVDSVERLEFGTDPVNQLAVIRSRFQQGHSQDTVIEKGQIQQTIEFLSSALASFEDQSPKH